MSRARVGDGLLVLLAVAAVVAPVRTLFTPDSWIPMALLLAVVVSATGMLARSLIARRSVVVLWQLGVGVLVTSWIFTREHLWYGLPGWSTILAANDLLYEARITITTYAPPAPANPGIVFAMALLVWSTVLVVDALAVTWSAPALAGVPLLAAFLVSASNSGAGMPAWYFLAASLAWLALLGRAGVFSVSRWDASGRRDAHTSSSRAVTRRLAATGRVVAMSAALVAVVAAALLPHLPTRFLLDGLGRADGSTGNVGNLTISSTVNLSRSLQSRSTAPVLTFDDTASSPGPLRIGTLDTYVDGIWSVGPVEEYLDELPDATVAGDEESIETVDVTMNGLGAPQLALPYPATSLSIDTQWRSTADGTVLVERRVDTYTADYLMSPPSEEVLQRAERWDSPADEVTASDLVLDPESYGLITTLLGEIVEPGASQIDIARAIQAHLRGSDYAYSLELADPFLDESGDAISDDPISHFLRTRTGYCVQFTAAMVMMARAEGIPARFVIGFLPGTPADSGERTVLASDAHAWPELYFEGAGWLRFEPTPGNRSGTAPAYTRAGYGDTASPEPTSTATATSGPAPVRPFEPPVDDLSTPGGATQPKSPVLAFAADYGWVAFVVLLGVLGALTMPLSAWWERRRRRRDARDDAARVEVIWQDLLERLDDVGITAPPDASPRQTGTYIGGATFLTQDSRTALRRVVAAVEESRYARPVATLDPDRIERIEKDAQVVASSVVGSLQRSDRVRSTWWPTAGVTAWQRRWENGATRSWPAVRDAVRRPRR